MGAAFSHMLYANVIEDVTTTIKNPQANAISEQLHQPISNSLQTMIHTYPPDNIDQINIIMDTSFATAACAYKVEIHCTLNMSPGALVFQRDMTLNTPLITALLHPHKQKQIIIDDHF